MALQGEGDPRWVVREREDGRNVNGWHWEDKDVTNWAVQRLKDLITRATCYSNSLSPGVAATSVDSVDGDATLYNRKGVLKVLYDLKVSGKWESLHEENDSRTHGEFKVEIFDDEPEVTVTMDSSSRSDSSYKRAFVADVSPKITKQCCVLIGELHKGADQFVDGMTLPKAVGSSDKTFTTSSRTEMGNTRSHNKTGPRKTSRNGKNSTTEIVMTEMFTCSARDWTLALTDVARLSAVTRSRAISEPHVGGRWEVLGGVASGKFVQITPGAELTLRWKLKSWGDEADEGIVYVVVNEDDGKTEARVSVNGVPKEKVSETEGFWRVQILQAMRVVMGWGSASNFIYM